MPKPLINVVAGLLIEDGKFFIARRADHDSNGGLWEFPGGKIEEGETPEGALVRELMEELNINVRVHRLFGETSFSTARADFKLYLYLCERLSGTILLSDHSAFAWISTAEITNFQFLSGDIPFLDKIKNEGLPRLR